MRLSPSVSGGNADKLLAFKVSDSCGLNDFCRSHDHQLFVYFIKFISFINN